MKKTNTNSLFENKLLAYSVAAGAVIACVNNINAQITGGSVNATLDEYEEFVDINFGGVSFKLTCWNSGSYGYVLVTMPASNSYLRVPDQLLVACLNSGAVVGSAASPWGHNNKPFVMKTHNGSVNYGSGFLNDNKYIGVKFNNSGTHYGWIRVKIIDTNPASLYVYDYAYNQTVGGSITCNGALPVEISSLSTIPNGKFVLLNWNTATEVNNYGFEIERSEILNGVKNLKTQTWQKIGFVEGSGNSNSPKEYSFTDKNVTAGNYSYRLKQIDIDGTFTYSSIVEVNYNPQPSTFELSQNYPNPFNPTTVIKFVIPSETRNLISQDSSPFGIRNDMMLVTLKVYDALGKEVAILVNEEKSAGAYEVKFDGSNLPSGIYLYKLIAGSYTASKKLMLVK